MQITSKFDSSVSRIPILLTNFGRYNEQRGGGWVVQWCWVNFQSRGVLLTWIRVGQGPAALAEGAGGGFLDIFLSSIISIFFLPLSGRPPDID